MTALDSTVGSSLLRRRNDGTGKDLVIRTEERMAKDRTAEDLLQGAEEQRKDRRTALVRVCS